MADPLGQVHRRGIREEVRAMTDQDRADTVIGALLDSAARTPDRTAFHVIERSEEEFALSYADVCHLVGTAVSGLDAHGIGEGERVLVVLPTSRDFLAVYLGCLYAGVVPVIAAEPTGGDPRHYAAGLRGLAEQARVSGVIATPEAADSLASYLPATVTTPDALRGEARTLDSPRATPGSLAHLQATSGSTGSRPLALRSSRSSQHPDDALRTCRHGRLRGRTFSGPKLEHLEARTQE